LLLVGTNVSATHFPVEIFEYVDDVRTVAFVNESDLEEDTRWKPFEGAPPLTIEEALEDVRGHMTSDTGLAGASVVEIELRKVPHHEQNWHYMVKLEQQSEGRTRYRYLVVLMSGKVIPAMKEPESVK
jgi:hypothetical protein